MKDFNEVMSVLSKRCASQLSLPGCNESTISMIEERFDKDYRNTYCSASKDEQRTIVKMFGQILGACICNSLNGTWAQHDALGTVVECKKGENVLIVSPFLMIEKFLSSGSEKSLIMIYEGMRSALSQSM